MRPYLDSMGLDRERFLKYVRLSASDQDGEALSAIRMANRALREERLTWDDVISGLVVPAPSPSAPSTAEGFGDPPSPSETVQTRTQAACSALEMAEIDHEVSSIDPSLLMINPGRGRKRIAYDVSRGTYFAVGMSRPRPISLFTLIQKIRHGLPL